MKKIVIAIIFLFSIILGFVIFKTTILQFAANYLIVEDELEKSDVIIVLGGEKRGKRTEKAVQLYQGGFAERLLFSDGTHLSWRVKAIDEMIALARKLGVPETAIYKEDQSRSTYENALYSKKIMEENGWDSAIIVTTNWHTRRSQFIFEKVFKDSGIKLLFAPSPPELIDNVDRWWEDSEKQQVILTEWAKLMIYWLKY